MFSEFPSDVKCLIFQKLSGKDILNLIEAWNVNMKEYAGERYNQIWERKIIEEFNEIVKADAFNTYMELRNKYSNVIDYPENIYLSKRLNVPISEIIAFRKNCEEYTVAIDMYSYYNEIIEIEKQFEMPLLNENLKIFIPSMIQKYINQLSIKYNLNSNQQALLFNLF